MSLPDDIHILVIGGHDTDYIPSNRTQVFNTQTLEWRTGPTLNSARSKMGCSVLNETVYVFGGDEGRIGFLSSIEKLDLLEGFPEQNAVWETLSIDLEEARCNFPTASTPNATYVLG